MEPFRGTARYEIVRELGAGGMGVVYEALDREKDGRRVALKVLQRHDAESLVRLKREFRALADVRHPNLATLYELSAEGDAWFFTLELVEGVDFLTWVRPGEVAQRDVPTAALDVTLRAGQPTGKVDLSRLRDAFRQLVSGIAFLHAQGRLHRDLKPSNVLVTKEGRVVVLDFGLVLELEGVQSISEARGSAIVGTAAYMAPEQAGSGVVGPSADWYALGVMLFQALTGRVPFDGVAVQVLLEKQRRPAPAPHELDASGPADLDALCVGLLKQEPAERPGAEVLLELFGAASGPVRSPKVQTDFVGRARELGALREALTGSRKGETRYVRLLGASGIGKSALVRRFVAEVDGVVLQGRCYERESVPFKALDSIMDALARHLSELPPEKVDAVLPRDAAALTRMFPVLGRVTAFRGAPVREAREAQELRRRAVQGLRELLGRMSDRSPVVLVIDDAQWGDPDSAQVLDDVLRPPDAPSVLLLIVARAESTPLEGLSLPSTELRLEPLGADDCERLARQTLEDPRRAAVIARESGGNPFLLQQLAAVSGEVRLEDVVLSRLGTLPPQARKLLDVVAVAGAPIAEKIASSIAGLEGSDVETVRLLKAANLIRGVHDDRVEAWHDRIRETVVNALEPERARDLHARLADGLKASGDVDVVAWHLGAAGLVERAADATLEAARRAVTQLAFERAAVLFERSLELMTGDDRRRREVRVALADAWASAGRGATSARAYELALTEPGEAPVAVQQSLEMRRLAAEQLLRSGHIDAGLAMVDQVLEGLGMKLARTPRRALLALGVRRAHLFLRGLSFVETPAARVDPVVLQRIDACWSVSMGLSMVDTIRGASFQSRQLLLALDAGEPHRVARALAAEAAYVATGGVRAEKKAARLVSEARELAERMNDAALIGLVDFCAGLTRFLVGRWREAGQLTAQAERRFAEVGSMVSWEAANSRLFSVWSLFYLGDVAGLSVRIPALTREAEQRGDRYAVTGLRCGLANVALLAADDAAGARAAVASAMASWSTRSFHFQHYWAALSETMIDLYLGETATSLSRMEACWRSLDSSQLLQIQNVRIEARSLIARVLIALGRGDEALRHADALEGEQVGWANALAAMIRGLVEPGHEAGLRTALELFDENEMALFSATTRLRLGEVQGGDVGAANVRAAGAWLKAQGVRNPQAMARMLSPCLPLPAGERVEERA
ncbi:MAG: protein kinase [Archangium sp.]|nr:protein kinase [Archangium sp.]